MRIILESVQTFMVVLQTEYIHLNSLSIHSNNQMMISKDHFHGYRYHYHYLLLFAEPDSDAVALNKDSNSSLEYSRSEFCLCHFMRNQVIVSVLDKFARPIEFKYRKFLVVLASMYDILVAYNIFSIHIIILNYHLMLIE